jgi:RNA polymerase sigma factor (sigma-70 family)
MMRIEQVVGPVTREPLGIADPRLLEQLQAERGQALFGFARRLGLTDEQATDAVQETLLRLWRELRAGRPVDDRPAWAFRTIYRIAMDEHRLSRRVAGLRDRLSRSGRTEVVARSGEVDRDELLVVWAEVDRLPIRQRHVLYLRYRADLPFDEIGAVLGITAGAARTLAGRALDSLRRRLADPEGDD